MNRTTQCLAWCAVALLLHLGLATRAEARPGYGAGCAECHTGSANMRTDPALWVTDLGFGSLPTYAATPGGAILVAMEILDGATKYAAELKDLDGAGHNNAAHHLAFTADATWVSRLDGSTPYFTFEKLPITDPDGTGIAWPSHAVTHTFNLQLNATTPLDVYKLTFAVATSGGGRRSDEQAFNLILLATEPGEKTWGIDANGNASVGTNWVGGVAPGGIGDAAGFTTIITAPRTLSIDAPLTLGSLRFDDNNNYTLAGANAITLQHSGANHAAINVVNAHGNGQHTIAAPLVVASDLDIAQNSTGELTLSGGLSTTAGRSLSKTGSGTLSISGLQSYGVGASFSHTAGTLNLLTDVGAGGANLALTARAAVNFTSSQHLAALRIGQNTTGTLSAGAGKVLVTNSLLVDAGGKLNLSDNDLVLRSTPAGRLADAAAVTALVASGFNAFAWNGPGLASSTAAADPSRITALGVMLNDNGLGGPYHLNFAGQAVDANSVLVKYTYYGDADLSGIVDGTDYALVDNGFNANLTGWFNGDFDFSGLVDGTDYALIDNAFNGQTGPLVAGPTGPAVPEPATASLGILGAGLVCLARRRLRR